MTLSGICCSFIWFYVLLVGSLAAFLPTKNVYYEMSFVPLDVCRHPQIPPEDVTLKE